MKKKKFKIKWKHIKIPEEFHAQLISWKKRHRIAIWKVLTTSFNFYVDAYRKHFKIPREKTEKIAWYIYKLSASVGAFRDNPSEENLNRLLLTIEQIKNRLNIPTRLLERAVKTYFDYPNKKNRIVLNDTCKNIIVGILVNESGD